MGFGKGRGGMGLASLRFGVASGLVCSAALVFQFDVAKLHIYLILKGV